MAKHSNVYYISEKDGTYTPCKNAVGVRNNMGLDLFRSKGLIYEGSTGAYICSEKRLDEMLNNLKGGGEKFKAQIREYADKYGLSPRYTQPEIRKDELFPRDDSRKLMKTLGHKEKCWFKKIDNVHLQSEFDLYFMDKDKSSYAKGIYTPCNGWMIEVGCVHEFEKALEFLRQPGFDLYSHIKESFESALSNPHRLADGGIAEFLGRIDEANEHNQPIKEMREAEDRERGEKREAARLEHEEREATEYKSAISDAEQAIIENKRVANKDINGKNLLLQLFRENGIELPLKTQGWVKTSLADINHKLGDGWAYRYYGRPSTVIEGYIDKLVSAVESKHRNLENGQPKDKSSIIGTIAENQKEIASRQTEDSSRRDKKKQTEI